MTYKTHICGGVSAALIITILSRHGYLGLTELSTPAIFGVFTSAILGSSFPDIDQPKSRIGQQLPVVSSLVRSSFGHRGFCHSLLFLLLIHYLVSIFLPSMAFYSYAFIAGAASHLFFDMFNSPGVPLLWPLKVRVRFAKIRTESPTNTKVANFPEKVFRSVWIIFDVLLAANLVVGSSLIS